MNDFGATDLHAIALWEISKPFLEEEKMCQPIDYTPGARPASFSSIYGMCILEGGYRTTEGHAAADRAHVEIIIHVPIINPMKDEDLGRK